VAAALNFPPGFLWGTASAAHQVEGDNRNNDWWLFEQQPGRIHGGDSSLIADDHYRRYREDFRLLRKMRNNAHRLSIEWSRVEPRRGEFDARQLRHYRDVLGELREQGLRPMLTLHHFTSPIWFTERGGWTAAEAPEAFLRFVRRVVDELGDLVDLWCTINEPNIYAANGWVVGEFPPGHQGDVLGMWRVLANMRRAHLAAYRAIHQKLPDAAVGLSHHRFLFLPERATRRDRLAARVAQGFMDRWPAGRVRREPAVETEADWIGIAHYWAQHAAFDPLRPQDQFIRRSNIPGVPLTDMGWASDPAWMRDVLNEVRHLGKPVYVTENGISAGDDAVREDYLPKVLRSVHGAIQDGVDVRGYFHWTGFDNFEWARGYSQKFGLIAVDRTTLERTVKPSGHLYARIAAANAVESE
jgi:beta-glucosidase